MSGIGIPDDERVELLLEIFTVMLVIFQYVYLSNSVRHVPSVTFRPSLTYSCVLSITFLQSHLISHLSGSSSNYQTFFDICCLQNLPQYHCSILLIKFRPSQHVRLRAMRFKSRLIEGTFLRGTTFILEMKVIRGLTKYLRCVSKLLQIGRCHFDFLQGGSCAMANYAMSND